MAIYRLGHVEVRVPDLDLCAAYYTEVLGLREVERDPTHVYLKAWDERDHHSVILTEAARYGVEHVASGRVIEAGAAHVAFSDS